MGDQRPPLPTADDEDHRQGSPRGGSIEVPALESDLHPRAIGSLTLDPATQSVEVDGTEVLLTRMEFGVMWLLSERPGRAVQRYELLDSVWGSAVFVDPGSLSVCVCRLRQKLERETGEACRFIRTVHGVGYRLMA